MLLDPTSNPQQLDHRRLLDKQKRQLKFKTCADVYDYWRTCKKRYAKAPKDGVEFEIDYIDTGSLIQQNQQAGNRPPTVLALHGAPGSYHDYALLIHHLSQQNVRVIAPNFPEYVATVKTKVLFRHSADEKAAYLRDFLKAINVNTIDLLISHSSAIFPSLLILLNANKTAISARKQQPPQEDKNQPTCTQTNDHKHSHRPSSNNNNNNNQRRQRRDSKLNRKQKVIVKFDEPIEIKALALFNPAAHRLPMSMKPVWFKCGSVNVYQHKLGRSLFRKLGPAFLTVIGVPVKVDNMDNVMLSATVMRNSRCQRVVKQLEQLSEMKLPTLLVFSENDRLIEKEIFYEMTRFMKLEEKKFDLYDNEGDIEFSQSNSNDWIRVMVFKEGGHYAYSNYAKTVNRAVSELLGKVVNEPV